MLFRNTLTLVLLFLVISAFGVSACAQTTGRITGIVRDGSGGTVSSAEVKAVNEATGEKWKAATDEAGNYSFVLLPPGLYEIDVAAEGFKTAVSKDVPVRITETSAINVSLAVGTRVEKIMVNGSPPLLQTDGPQLGRVVGSRAVAELPLVSRNFTQILTLSPRTAGYLPHTTAVARNTQAISVNGPRVTQNYFQINGIYATTLGIQGPILHAVPPPLT